MNKIVVVLAVCALASCADASWYWPFGGKSEEKETVRISDLMEPASLLIDEASDFAADGKVSEAKEKYEQALAELERIEFENPERAATSEFSTVRNKKAYINAAIDSLLLSQAQKNAKAVAVTDTTELEKKFAAEKAEKAKAKGQKSKTSPGRGGDAKKSADRRAKIKLAAEALANKDYAGAKAKIGELLKEKPNDAAALNLRAAVEAAEGDLDVAEATLTQLIQSNPSSHFGYYNLAKLVLQKRGDAGKQQALLYYKTGREDCGGPEDKALEGLLK